LPDPRDRRIMAFMRSTKRKNVSRPSSKPRGTDWSDDWEVAVRVWIERRGRTILGEGLADLLIAIEQTRSISAAARLLGISYRHAWNLVQEGNTAAGEPLVSSAVGGLHGGGAQLTPRGKLSLRIFDDLRRRVRETAAGLLQETLRSWLDHSPGSGHQPARGYRTVAHGICAPTAEHTRSRGLRRLQ
jgi:molybdate transport system regulatory protein